jgi:hypothetical protein
MFLINKLCLHCCFQRHVSALAMSHLQADHFFPLQGKPYNEQSYLTFIGPCIVMYSYSNTNQIHQSNKLFLCNTVHVSDGLSVHRQEFKTVHFLCLLKDTWGPLMVAQWLRYCATNRKVAGSIPDGVIGIFH